MYVCRQTDRQARTDGGHKRAHVHICTYSCSCDFTPLASLRFQSSEPHLENALEGQIEEIVSFGVLLTYGLDLLYNVRGHKLTVSSHD